MTVSAVKPETRIREARYPDTPQWGHQLPEWLLLPMMMRKPERLERGVTLMSLMKKLEKFRV